MDFNQMMNMPISKLSIFQESDSDTLEFEKELKKKHPDTNNEKAGMESDFSVSYNDDSDESYYGDDNISDMPDEDDNFYDNPHYDDDDDTIYGDDDDFYNISDNDDSYESPDSEKCGQEDVGAFLPQIPLTGTLRKSEVGCDCDLSEEEEDEKIAADFKLIATPILLGDTMTDDEITEFKESTDSDIAIEEGYYEERTIVKMDKHAKKSQLIKVATITIARRKKDPLYKKLSKVWDMERRLEKLIYDKYRSKAVVYVNDYLKHAKHSKVKSIKDAVGKFFTKK